MTLTRRRLLAGATALGAAAFGAGGCASPMTADKFVPSQVSGDLTQRLLAALAGGACLPDITMIGDNISRYFGDSDRFVNMNDHGARELAAEYLPWKWQAGATPTASSSASPSRSASSTPPGSPARSSNRPPAAGALPDELLDAARIDGCGFFRTYLHVGLPVLRPALAFLGIFTFVNVWNDFLWPPVVLIDSRHITLKLALAQLNGLHVTDYSVVMAGTLVAIVPLIIIFLFGARHFIRNIAAGALKG